MGRPKEGVALSDGRRMIEHVIEPLRGVCQRVAIVGACRGYPIPAGIDIIHLNDSQPGEPPQRAGSLGTPGAGPLVAIATLLRSGLDSEGYLVVACDQPFLTSPLLGLLMEDRSPFPRFFRSEGGTPLDPFPGYFPVGWFLEIGRALQQGERSVRRLIERTPVSWIPIPDEFRGFLKNINTPADLERAQQSKTPRQCVSTRTETKKKRGADFVELETRISAVPLVPRLPTTEDGPVTPVV